MSIPYCYICEKNPIEARRLGESRLRDGMYCPVCHQPTCSQHMATVRWRWRDKARGLGHAQVCIECKRSYRHRDWDPINRDWIS